MIPRLSTYTPLQWLQKTVQHSVMVATAGVPAQLCHLVSATGSFALNTILGRGDGTWAMSAGSLSVVTEPNPADGGNPYRLEMDADSGLTGIEFHAWALWVPELMGGAKPDIKDVVYLDFNSNYYQQWAERTAIPWNRPDLDSFSPLIGGPQYLNEVYRVALMAKPNLAEMLCSLDHAPMMDCCREWLYLNHLNGWDLLTEEFKTQLAKQISEVKANVAAVC